MQSSKNATETVTEFSKQIRKANQTRLHLFHNSYGCKDYWLHFKKQTGYQITQALYTQILRTIMLNLIDKYVITRLNLNFPNKMGSIRIDDIKQKVVKEDNKYIKKGPVDWNKTLQLWANDTEAYQMKCKIYSKYNNVACLKYFKKARSYANQQYFYIKFSRSLKKYIYNKMILNDNFNLNG